MLKFRAGSSRPLLTTAEYAEIRNCSVRTIEGERASGTGARFLKINGMVRYRAEDVSLSWPRLSASRRKAARNDPALSAARVWLSTA